MKNRSRDLTVDCADWNRAAMKMAQRPEVYVVRMKIINPIMVEGVWKFRPEKTIGEIAAMLLAPRQVKTTIVFHRKGYDIVLVMLDHPENGAVDLPLSMVRP